MRPPLSSKNQWGKKMSAFTPRLATLGLMQLLLPEVELRTRAPALIERHLFPVARQILSGPVNKFSFTHFDTSSLQAWYFTSVWL